LIILSVDGEFHSMEPSILAVDVYHDDDSLGPATDTDAICLTPTNIRYIGLETEVFIGVSVSG